MKAETLESLSQADFEQALEAHVTWAAEWEGTLPAETFFGVWGDLQRANQPIELKARIVAGELRISAPPDSGIRVVDNHLLLENGVELVLTLEG
ncbi:MAG: hypothetical protein HUU38_16295 [Anaerolineales bacterium]|nr:hypothetical protein [Anaerolineales bacterium]